MILDKLQPATFRDFRFLIPRTQLTDGRKTVSHEFVNSNNRFVEDLGQFPQKFKVTAIVHGVDAIGQRDSFRTILNKPGSGILVHPSYGRQTVAVDGQYTVTDTDSELGQFKFEITFSIDSGAAFPGEGNPTTSTVAAAEQTARVSILQRISDQWTIPGTVLSTTDAATKLATYAEDIAGAFNGIVEDASAIVKVADSITDNAISLVQSGPDVASSVAGILAALDGIPTESLATLAAIKGFLNFGFDDVEIVNAAGLSSDQIARQTNRDLLNSIVQATSLVKAYTTSTLVDFRIVSRLNENRSELSSSSRSIINTIRNAAVDFDASTAAGVRINTTRDRDAINDMLDTGTLTDKILSANAENLYRLTTVKVPLTSARLLSYALFESDSETAIIADLNNGQKPSSLSGMLEAINV